MIKECLEIFESELEKNPDLILSDYIPKDGRYILVEMNEEEWKVISDFDIKKDKKEKSIIGSNEPNYQYVKELDYYSCYINSNKAIGGLKNIYSSNYLTLFFKANALYTKVDEEYINKYFDILKNIKSKYKDKSRKLYDDIEQKIGPVDTKLVNKIQNWVLINIDKLNIETDKEGTIRIYFIFDDKEKTLDLYKNENIRYVYMKLYNKNDYNILVEDEILGLSDNNIGLDTKKPYLANLGRKTKEPFMITREQALLQKQFFDYLGIVTNNGIYKIYFDIRNRSIKFENNIRFGYEMDLSKEKKEIAIKSFKFITKNNTDIDFEIKKYIPEIIIKDNVIAKKQIKNMSKVYKKFNKRYEFFTKLDSIFFKGYLINMSKSLDKGHEIKDMDIKNGKLKLMLQNYGYAFINWKNYDDEKSIQIILKKLFKDLFFCYSKEDGFNSFIRKLNLYLSLCEYFKEQFTEDFMKIGKLVESKILEKDEYIIESDEECFFVIGQVCRYILDNTNISNRNLRFIQNLLNKKNKDKFVDEFILLVKRYKHIFTLNYVAARAGKLISAVVQFDITGDIEDKWIIAGFFDTRYIYATKENKENKENKDNKDNN